MNRLREIALHGRDNDAVRACEAILDRAWGRTSQHILQGADNPKAFDEDGALLPIQEMPEEIRRAISSIEVEEIFVAAVETGLGDRARRLTIRARRPSRES